MDTARGGDLCLYCLLYDFSHSLVQYFKNIHFILYILREFLQINWIHFNFLHIPVDWVPKLLECVRTKLGRAAFVYSWWAFDTFKICAFTSSIDRRC